MSLEGYQIDQYRFERLLRSGGMGEIYLAYDEHLDRQLAIKVIWTDTSRYPDIQAARDAERLFLREMQVIAQLDHINILPVYGSGEASIDDRQLMFMVMPFRQHGSLADWLQQRDRARPISLKVVEWVVKQAASGLQYAHNRQIIHQDVKPSNFLIQGEAEVPNQLNLQLADFGIAKLMTTTSESQTIRGTPTYMAPEQWDGHPVPATDQYALAVMTYELLTGYPPFLGKNNQQMWHLHFHVSPRPPSAINPAIPQALNAVMLRALEKNPDGRYSSVAAFARAFQQAVPKSGSSVVNNSIEEAVPSLASSNVAPMPVRNVSNDVVVSGQQKRGIGGKAILMTFVVLVLIAASILGFFALRIYPLNNIQPNVNTGTTNGPDTASTNTVNAVNTSTTIAMTATAQANETGTAQTNATAQNNLTATAQANATATSQAIATATAFVNAKATATAQAIATIYATAVTPGNPILNDPLQNNNQGNNWDTGNTAIAGDGSCVFTGGDYHSKPPQIPSFAPCFAQATRFSNFSFQVQMTIVQGDQGGIIFRANKSNGTFYYFHINRNGSFALEVYDHFSLIGVLQNGSNSVIKTGLNQTNLLAVIASDNNLILYVNKQQVASVSDSTYSAGQIGVIAESIQNATDIGFSNAQVWLR